MQNLPKTRWFSCFPVSNSEMSPAFSLRLGLPVPLTATSTRAAPHSERQHLVFTWAMHVLYTDFLLSFSFNYWTLRLIHYWKQLLLYLAQQFYILPFPSLQMKEEGETWGKLEIYKVASLAKHPGNLRFAPAPNATGEDTAGRWVLHLGGSVSPQSTCGVAFWVERKERPAKIETEAAQIDEFVNQVDKPLKPPGSQPLDTREGMRPHPALGRRPRR